MKKTHIYCESGFSPARNFRTGVSLHGHTLHSKESLNFIYPLAKKVAPIRMLLEQGKARYRAHHGVELDLNNGWWTPPLSAHQAWTVEARQIRERFQMDALVSLSDHDDIEGPITLQVMEETRLTPISVEWTVPYRETFFHIGVHNLPSEQARALMARMALVTDRIAAEPLAALLSELAAKPDTLIVFNHPNWDESGIGPTAHRALAREFAQNYRHFLHAFELNGLRPWSENRDNLELAKDFDKPVVAGGDRHGIEPNTLFNLSNAGTFSEFAVEVRAGFSEVFVTQQYQEPFARRILQNFEDVLSDMPGHAHGWTRWSDRAFFLCPDGVTRSLGEAWGENGMRIQLFTRGLQLVRHPHLKNAFRWAFARREEVLL